MSGTVLGSNMKNTLLIKLAFSYYTERSILSVSFLLDCQLL